MLTSTSKMKLLLMILLLGMMGCSQRQLVWSRLSAPSEYTKGALRIATNKKIPVNVEGTNQIIDVDLGGFIVVHEDDFALIVKRLKEQSNKSN
jgi:hypothetical protein